MNVNEERLKEIMAHETDADGCPKTYPDGIEKEEDRGKEGKESVSIPDGRTEKPTVFHKPAVRSGTSLAVDVLPAAEIVGTVCLHPFRKGGP